MLGGIGLKYPSMRPKRETTYREIYMNTMNHPSDINYRETGSVEGGKISCLYFVLVIFVKRDTRLTTYKESWIKVPRLTRSQAQPTRGEKVSE